MKLLLPLLHVVVSLNQLFGSTPHEPDVACEDILVQFAL